MPKLVEIPEPPTPQKTIEDQWYWGDEFLFYNFTESELDVSGFYDLMFWDDEKDEDGNYFLQKDGTLLEGCPQGFVLRIFEERLSGVFRALWLSDGDWSNAEITETVLYRFPRDVSDKVREIIKLVDTEKNCNSADFVQCVAFLHAYTGLPLGEKSASQLQHDNQILNGGVLGDVMTKITKGSLRK